MQDHQPPRPQTASERDAHRPGDGHTAEGQRGRYASDHEDTRHPEVGPIASSRPNLDRLVSTAHDYSQAHWHDGLAEALDRQRALQHAAGVELAAVEERQRDLNRQHGEWAAQAQAHGAAADAIERVIGDLHAQDDERRKRLADDDESDRRRTASPRSW